MAPIPLRLLRAQFKSARSLFLLSVAGVALGVASIVSIQIVEQSALGAFEGTVRAISNEADFSVVGRGPTVSEELLPDILSVSGVAAAWPVLRVDVALMGREETYLQVVGLDLLRPSNLPWDGPAPDLAGALSERGWAAITPELARREGLGLGDPFEVSSGTRVARLRVGALVDFERTSPLASSRLVILDIAQAQDLLGLRGFVQQIDVRLHARAPAEVRSNLERALGPSVQTVTTDERRRDAEGLLEAFELNLEALGLVSLFVGAFLVSSSTRATLARRRTEFGLLRSLGATRAQVTGLILAEVTVLGAFGTAFGIGLGWLVAASSVGDVSRTLSNLYLLERVESLRLSPSTVASAIGFGFVGAIGGALAPAIEAARRDPRALLGRVVTDVRAQRLARPMAWIAVGLLVGSAALWPILLGRLRYGGFVAGIVLLVAMPLLAPWWVERLSRSIRLGGFGLAEGLRGLSTRLAPAAFAVAALAMSVSLLFGITWMVESFRRTVEVWLDASARADIYVTSASWRRARELATLEPSIVDSIASLPGIRAIDRLRQFQVETAGRKILLGAADFGLDLPEGRLALLAGDRDRAMRAVADERAVLISEPLSRKAGLGLGDRLVLQGRDREISLQIAGVYYDYAAEGGSAAIDWRTAEEIFGPGQPNSLALYLDPGVDPEQTVDSLLAKLTGVPLEIRSNRSLRKQVFAIFDQTFVVTRLLELMSLVIAACGITLTLVVLARERASEIALYRALGAGRAQILRLWLGKGLGIGLAGLALGALGGVGLAAILVFAINRQYFGWTIVWSWPWAALVRESVWILFAAILASVYPALRATRTPATELARE